MNHSRFDFAKRVTAAIVLALFMSQVSLPVWGTARAWAAPVPVDKMDTRAVLKSEAALDETDRTTGGARKANVLIMVEATPPMSYTPRGVTPTTIRDWDWYNNEEAINWTKTKQYYGMDFDDINNANWHATFGIGMMPPAWSGQNLRKERNLYGRERLEQNNLSEDLDLGSITVDEFIELNKDKYYFPFKDPAAANKVRDAYKSQTTKLETHFTGVPVVPKFPTNLEANEIKHWFTNTKDTQGISVTGDWTYNNLNSDKGFPYALVFKDPRHWAGWTGAKPPTSADLVPNDSRMYQTKLVLWRLLEDESLFKGIRFGLATTFLSPVNGNTSDSGQYNAGDNNNDHNEYFRRTDMNGIFRVAPYGSNVPTMRFFEKNADGSFKKGADGKLIPSRFFYYGEYRPRGTGGRNGTNGYWDTFLGLGIEYPKDIAKYDAAKNPIGIEMNTNPGTGYGQKWYTNGILTSPITGHLRFWSGIHGQYIVLWQNLPIGLNYSMSNVRAGLERGTEWNDRTRSSYRVLNRASLHVPINDYKYNWKKTGKDGKTVAGMEISHADKFRLWIDGFADIKSGGTNLYDPGYWILYNGVIRGSAGENAERIARRYPNHSNRWKQWHFYNNPEIGVAGSFSLPQAIFPDPRAEWNLNRQSYLDNGWIWYSLKGKNVNYHSDLNQFSADADSPGLVKAFFNADSGEAAGSVLDFFSPPVFKNGSLNFTIPYYDSAPPTEWWDRDRDGERYTGSHARHNEVGYSNGKNDKEDGTQATGNNAVTWKHLGEASFPIRSACEDNWVIVITSGQEVEPLGVDGAYKYTAADAIKNLYDYTRDNKVTMLPRNADGTPKTKSDGTYALEEVKLDNPIRTLVIGIVADPDTMDEGPEKDHVIKMRENVTRMARAGGGDDPDDENSEFEPYFADNVETLFNNIKAALVAVNESQVQQPGVGAMTETPPVEGEIGTSNMFATTYRIIEGNQWDGELWRYVVSEDEDGNTTVSADWELGKNLLAARGGRKLKYWGQDGQDKKFKDWNGTGLDKLLGMTDDRVTVEGLDISGYSPPMEDAFYRWFQGYDFSYKKSGENARYLRSSMLADIGKSGVVFADYPSSSDTLPGYGQWGARHNAVNANPRLYAQGNDGVLHVIEPSTGRETDAILPPPALLPWRLATLKTDLFSGKIQWRNVGGGEKASPGFRSNPAYILDGSLQKKDIDMREDGPAGERQWGTYLLGALGRGGSGLYMLKLEDTASPGLTDPSKPQFVWYREKLGDAQINMDSGMTEPVIVPSSEVTDEKEHAFSKLGFNSPMPAMGLTGWASGKQKNFIALAGGAQYDYKSDDNGKEGAVLLFLDSSDGSVIEAFDSKLLEEKNRLRIGGGDTGTAPYMGMMTSVPTLVRSELDNYRVGRVYASDNRGNIFKVKLEDRVDGEFKTLAPDDWKIDTIATLQESEREALSLPYSYSVPHGLVCGVSRGSYWLAGGTKDVGIKVSETLEDGILLNRKQMIFAFRDKGDISRPEIRGLDWKGLTPGGDDALTQADGKSGWFIPLEEDRQNYFREYVTAKPVLVGGVLFVSTFIERKPLDVTDPSVCGLVRVINGDSRLYAINVTNGGGVFWKGDNDTQPKYITFEGIKITGMNLVASGSGRRLIFRFDTLTERADLLGRPRQDNIRRVAGAKDLGQILDLPSGGGSGKGNLPPETTFINYWLAK